MSFCLKVCIYSHTRGVKLGLGLGFMQTSQVLPHWLNQSFSFWTLSYTQRHCHVRIEKSPNCCYNIRRTQFPRISLYALTLRFVLIEITKVVKPVHQKGATQYFWQYSVHAHIYIYTCMCVYMYIIYTYTHIHTHTHTYIHTHTHTQLFKCFLVSLHVITTLQLLL